MYNLLKLAHKFLALENYRLPLLCFSVVLLILMKIELEQVTQESLLSLKVAFVPNSKTKDFIMKEKNLFNSTIFFTLLIVLLLLFYNYYI